MVSNKSRWANMMIGCWIILASIALAPAYALADQDWSVDEELWYVLEMGGGKAGWMSNVIERSDEQYRTTNTTYMKIDRGGISAEIEMTSAFIETLDGKPVRIDITMATGQQPVKTAYVFTPENLVITTTQAGKSNERKTALPEGEWLTPMAIERFAAQQREAGANEYSYRTLNPQTSPRPIKVTSTLVEKSDYEFNGKKFPVTVWNTRADIMKDLVTLEKFDEQGNLVYQEVPIAGLGNVRTRLATKAQAKAEGGPVPELLFSTVIKPDKPIENSLKATKAKLRLRVKDGKMPELPTAGSQRAELSEDGKTALLTIDINDPVAAGEDEKKNSEFLEPSSTVNSDDQMVQKLAKTARIGSKSADSDVMDRAEALRKKVHDHISKKGMATAFATASETARTRTGDCSEHGVLLCAMLRADGIPARVATGLVYVDAFAGESGIFGWHMWTQALIDGEWVDLDATLPVRYDAAHVLTSTSSLADGLTGTDMMSVIQLIGNLDIEVVDVQYD